MTLDQIKELRRWWTEAQVSADDNDDKEEQEVRIIRELCAYDAYSAACIGYIESLLDNPKESL